MGAGRPWLRCVAPCGRRPATRIERYQPCCPSVGDVPRATVGGECAHDAEVTGGAKLRTRRRRALDRRSRPTGGGTSCCPEGGWGSGQRPVTCRGSGLPLSKSPNLLQQIVEVPAVLTSGRADGRRDEPGSGPAPQCRRRHADGTCCLRSSDQPVSAHDLHFRTRWASLACCRRMSELDNVERDL